MSKIHSEELPDNKICPFTGRPADTIVWLRVDCESKWVRGNEPLSTQWKLIYILIFGWVGGIFALIRSSTPIEEFGREVYFDLPLKISREAISMVRRLKSQSKLRKALVCSSSYVDLLNEYPSAHVSVKGIA
jgi:hypothetical protein